MSLLSRNKAKGGISCTFVLVAMVHDQETDQSVQCTYWWKVDRMRRSGFGLIEKEQVGIFGIWMFAFFDVEERLGCLDVRFHLTFLATVLKSSPPSPQRQTYRFVTTSNEGLLLISSLPKEVAKNDLQAQTPKPQGVFEREPRWLRRWKTRRYVIAQWKRLCIPIYMSPTLLHPQQNEP